MGAIVLPDPSGLAQGITQAGSALAGALQQRRQQQQMQQQQQQAASQQAQYGNILQGILENVDIDASPIQLTQAFGEAVKQGVPMDMINQYGTLFSTLQKAKQGMPAGPQQIEEMSGLFEKFGMPTEIASRNAELWGQLTTGGQTEMAKLLVDQIARGQYGGGMPPQSSPVGGEDATVSVDETAVFQWPEVDVFEDRTPKERAALKTELLKTNNQELKEINKAYKGAINEMRSYEQLERLNDRGNLPKGLGRLNINWSTGDIKIPAAANADTQLFVKTINDFTTKAKETFGARVTNFELGAFLKRLPTLANTEEGRRVIIEQMKAITSLNKLHQDSLRQVYNKYGIQNIDRSTAETIAENLRKDDEEKLIQDYENSIQAQDTYEAKQQAPEGRIAAKSPSGEIVYIRQDQADKAEQKGYSIL